MFNYLIICTKEGIALRHFGTIPNGYDVDFISNIASMANSYSKTNKQDQVLPSQDYTIFIKSGQQPYAKAKDGSEIRFIEGSHLNAVVSINDENDLMAANFLFNEKDQPTNFTGEIFKPSLVELMDDFVQEVFRTRK